MEIVGVSEQFLRLCIEFGEILVRCHYGILYYYYAFVKFGQCGLRFFAFASQLIESFLWGVNT